MLSAVVLGWAAPSASAQNLKAKVQVTGINGDLRKNVLAVLSIERIGSKGKLTADEIRRLHEQAPTEIRLALQPFGYYRPHIESELTPGSGTWNTRYKVDPGPAIRLDRVDVRLEGPGRDDPEMQRLVEKFPLEAGDTLRHDLYEGGKKSFMNRAADRGYLDAVFDSSQIRVDTGACSASMILVYRTGPRYLFGQVTLHQDAVDTLLLIGLIPFKKGDTLSASKLGELQSNLSEAPYFSQALVDVRRDDAVGLEVPIDVTLVNRSRRRFEVGAGYGTDTGFRGRLEAKFRRLNRKGHNASIRLDVSQIERTLTAQYQMPPVYPLTATWAISTGLGDFSPGWSKSRRATIAVSPSRQLLGWRVAAGLAFEADAFEVASRKDSSLLLILSNEWTRIRADNIMFPEHGISLRIGARGAHDAVLSTVSFLQVGAKFRLVQQMLGSIRGLARFRVEETLTNDFSGLPPFYRQVTGGAQTLRGFEYESVGPRDETGQLIGGESLLLSSVELDWMLIKGLGRWGAAVFADAGNAFDTYRSFSIEVGAGFGIRWVSPVGVLRIDWAWPLSSPERGRQVHFSMGPDL